MSTTTSAMPTSELTSPVLLFDGVCNLCNGFVNFVIKHDPAAIFKFASLQSEVAQQLLASTSINPKDLSTVILVVGKKIYTHSDVAIQVGQRLGGVWRVMSWFAMGIPSGWRNRFYNWIARNRYVWFGKKETCMIPTPALRHRFL